MAEGGMPRAPDEDAAGPLVEGATDPIVELDMDEGAAGAALAPEMGEDLAWDDEETNRASVDNQQSAMGDEVCKRARTRTRAHAHAHTHILAQPHTRARAHTHTHTHTHTHARTPTRTHTRTRTRTRAHTRARGWDIERPY